ncbi:MAG: ferric reductase-like transmembrane domain-containing protein [Bacillaceae bacterium]|nr:ferric reductase-like transmembrane domain-containing protein [Bacillaceae bacterium]
MIKLSRIIFYIVMILISWVGWLWLKGDFAHFSSLQSWSMILGYLAFVFVSLTLVVGPLHRLIPASWTSYLLKRRRDIGIWSGVLAILHVATVIAYVEKGESFFFIADSYSSNMQGWLSLFLNQGYNGGVSILYNLSGTANYLGLVAFLFLMMMWLTSSDRARDRLGPATWRRIHGFNVMVFTLVIFHAVTYVRGIKGSPHGLDDFLIIAGIVIVIRAAAFIRVIYQKRT